MRPPHRPWAGDRWYRKPDRDRPSLPAVYSKIHVRDAGTSPASAASPPPRLGSHSGRLARPRARRAAGATPPRGVPGREFEPEFEPSRGADLLGLVSGRLRVTLVRGRRVLSFGRNVLGLGRSALVSGRPLFVACRSLLGLAPPLRVVALLGVAGRSAADELASLGVPRLLLGLLLHPLAEVLGAAVVRAAALVLLARDLLVGLPPAGFLAGARFRPARFPAPAARRTRAGAGSQSPPDLLVDGGAAAGGRPLRLALEEGLVGPAAGLSAATLARPGLAGALVPVLLVGTSLPGPARAATPLALTARTTLAELAGLALPSSVPGLVLPGRPVAGLSAAGTPATGLLAAGPPPAGSLCAAVPSRLARGSVAAPGGGRALAGPLPALLFGLAAAGRLVFGVLLAANHSLVALVGLLAARPADLPLLARGLAAPLALGLALLGPGLLAVLEPLGGLPLAAGRLLAVLDGDAGPSLAPLSSLASPSRGLLVLRTSGLAAGRPGPLALAVLEPLLAALALGGSVPLVETGVRPLLHPPTLLRLALLGLLVLVTLLALLVVLPVGLVLGTRLGMLSAVAPLGLLAPGTAAATPVAGLATAGTLAATPTAAVATSLTTGLAPAPPVLPALALLVPPALVRPAAASTAAGPLASTLLVPTPRLPSLRSLALLLWPVLLFLELLVGSSLLPVSLVLSLPTAHVLEAVSSVLITHGWSPETRAGTPPYRRAYAPRDTSGPVGKVSQPVSSSNVACTNSRRARGPET